MDKEKTKEKKDYSTLIFIGVLTILTIIGIIFDDKLFGATSVFYNNVSSNTIIQTLYQKIPALVRTIQIITIAMLIFLLIKFLLKKLLSRTNKSKTVATLLTSFIKWLLAIVAVFISLNAWGVNTTTLLASAGILTLIIGLGAQSLIADIIAGIFIVFEGEYQVGDIIIIDGWRGTVLEIGIRTTKIEDAGGNIKIINNSAITSVINQTQDLSIARCVVGTEYSDRIEKLEEIIQNNLEKIKEAIPAIKEGPFYRGITELGNSSVNLLFIAKCNEEDIYQVQRDLNRQIKIMFDDNNINIPFPQIVLNNREKGEKVTVTKEEKAQAEKFMEEQRQLTKGIKDEEDLK